MDIANMPFVNGVNFHPGCRIQSRDFRYQVFRGIQLHQANLCRNDFTGADFQGADLTGTDFRETNLTGADFRHASLRRADFRGANVTDTRFPEQVWRLRGARFHSTQVFLLSLTGQLTQDQIPTLIVTV